MDLSDSKFHLSSTNPSQHPKATIRLLLHRQLSSNPLSHTSSPRTNRLHPPNPLRYPTPFPPTPMSSHFPHSHPLTGSFWDFTSDLSSADTAYTTLALAAHTDTTYFTDPCGLQLFHLLSHTDGSGGASLLVDGFSAAATLKLEAPDVYEVLSTVNVPAHASGNEGVSIRPARAFPVLNHDPETRRLVQVRWNNDDRGTLSGDQATIGDWYLAARKWVEILRRGRSEYWEQLRPGRPLSKCLRH